jgi:23S rRNA (cytidine1920-2'-O)/16S rRNA (cytidine1409-2'-O)-methyltransferase
VRRARLDAELVRRGLARSREHAQELLAGGRVSVRGSAAAKPATQVDPDAPIQVRDEHPETTYVSRGGHKLAGALDAFSLAVEGRRALDAGASTGGFTDVLVRRGAAAVVAVDVGYGQLAWALRGDPRVTILDRTNVRSLTLDQIPGGAVDLVVADLSFISLGLVLPALVGVATTDADLVVMVKPQFEVGRERLGRGGVVREAALRSEVVRTIAERAAALGWGTAGVTASLLPGPAGNVEYFLWLRVGAPPPDPRAIDRAIEEGPT